MPAPSVGVPVLAELKGLPSVERARFVARQRAAGLKMEQIGQLLGITAQRAGQLLKRHQHDPECQALRDIGSAIKLQRKGAAALSELVDAGLALVREAATDPSTDRKERAATITAAVAPAHRLLESSEKVLRRHQIGAVEASRQTFDHTALLDAVAAALEKIKTLPAEHQEAARQALTASLHRDRAERPVIDVEALVPAAEPDGDDGSITPF